MSPWNLLILIGVAGLGLLGLWGADRWLRTIK